MVLPRTGSPKYNKSGTGSVRSGLRVNDSCRLIEHFERHIMRVWRGISFVREAGMLMTEPSSNQTPNTSYGFCR